MDSDAPFGVCRYGLGTCYLRQSKIRLAEFHYRKAAAIHPSNAVLLGCVGMVSGTPFGRFDYVETLILRDLATGG